MLVGRHTPHLPLGGEALQSTCSPCSGLHWRVAGRSIKTEVYPKETPPTAHLARNVQSLLHRLGLQQLVWPPRRLIQGLGFVQAAQNRMIDSVSPCAAHCSQRRPPVLALTAPEQRNLLARSLGKTRKAWPERTKN